MHTWSLVGLGLDSSGEEKVSLRIANCKPALLEFWNPNSYYLCGCKTPCQEFKLVSQLVVPLNACQKRNGSDLQNNVP